MIPYILFSLLCGTVGDIFLCQFLRLRFYPFTVLISVGVVLALYMALDDPLSIIKGFLFTQILILIGFIDAKTHQIPDWFLIPIFLSGLIQFQPVSSVIGLLTLSLPLLLLAMVSRGGIGGGDVKLMAATGFVLGPVGVTSGAFLAFTLFLILYPLLRHFHKKATYAMAPYISIGCFLAYVLKL